MKAQDAFSVIASTPQIHSILDIGSGSGLHAEAFRKAGKEVTTISLVPPADFVGFDYMSLAFDSQYDCIWASHVLEHQPNVNAFLRKCRIDLKPGGILAVTVPPMKHEIVGGHLTAWNAGLLLYNLVMAGFDCSKAKVKTYKYNISVIVQKVADITLDSLHMDAGDIEKLSPYFPMPVAQGFNGNIESINW
jgi:SAM-dependent methyltransferase